MVVVGLLQMEPERSKDLAYEKIVEFVSEAKSQGAEVVCTPEYYLTSFEEHTESDAESIPGPTKTKLTKLANREDIYIVASLLKRGVSPLQQCRAHRPPTPRTCRQIQESPLEGETIHSR